MRAFRLALALTGALLLALLATVNVTGFAVRVPDATPAVLYWPSAFLALLALYCGWRGMTRIEVPLLVVSLGLMITLFTYVMSYGVHALRMPLADDALLAADRAIGVDWMAIALFFDRNTWLLYPMHACYSALSAQLVVAALAVSVLRPAAEAYRFVAIYALASLVTLALAALWPTIGMTAWLDLQPFQHLRFDAAYATRDAIGWMRAGAFERIDFAAPTIGMLSFPSFHTVGGCLAAYAVRKTILRIPALLTNGALIVGTVPFGQHYAMDTLAGLGIFVACVAALPYAERLLSSLWETARPRRRATVGDTEPAALA